MAESTTERQGAQNINETERRGAARAAQGLDVPDVTLHDLVKPSEDRYYEDENHRPESLYQYGTVDTTDQGGGVHGGIHNMSPVFAEARAQNLLVAKRALDPEDHSVPPELVTLPEGTVTVSGTAKTAEEGREDVASALRALVDEPVRLGTSPAEQEAAEEHEDSTEDSESTERRSTASRTVGDRDGDGDVDAKDAAKAATGAPKTNTASSTTSTTRTTTRKS